MEEKRDLEWAKRTLKGGLSKLDLSELADLSDAVSKYRGELGDFAPRVQEAMNAVVEKASANKLPLDENNMGAMEAIMRDVNVPDNKDLKPKTWQKAQENIGKIKSGELKANQSFKDKLVGSAVKIGQVAKTAALKYQAFVKSVSKPIPIVRNEKIGARKTQNKEVKPSKEGMFKRFLAGYSKAKDKLKNANVGKKIMDFLYNEGDKREAWAKHDAASMGAAKLARKIRSSAVENGVSNGNISRTVVPNRFEHTTEFAFGTQDKGAVSKTDELRKKMAENVSRQEKLGANPDDITTWELDGISGNEAVDASQEENVSSQAKGGINPDDMTTWKLDGISGGEAVSANQEENEFAGFVKNPNAKDAPEESKNDKSIEMLIDKYYQNKLRS